MTSPVQLLAIAVSLLLLLVVLELVRRHKLTEEYSFFWLLGALALLLFSIYRELLHVVAAWLGVFYPPAVLLLLLTVIVFVGLLYFSVAISRERARVDRLVEEVALLSAELRRRDGAEVEE